MGVSPMQFRSGTRLPKMHGRDAHATKEAGRKIAVGELTWPRKCELFDVRVSATCYDEAVEAITRAARKNESAAVTAFAVHGLVTAAEDSSYRDKIDTFEIISPDGQPV